MPNYIFILRKKGIEIELNSPDKDFISRQMKVWQNTFMPVIGLSPKIMSPEPAVIPAKKSVMPDMPVQKVVETVEEVSPLFEEVPVLPEEPETEEYDTDEVQISEAEIAATLAEAETIVSDLVAEIPEISEVLEVSEDTQDFDVAEDEDKSYPAYESIVEEIEEMEEETEEEPEIELTEEFEEVEIPGDYAKLAKPPVVETEEPVIEGMDELDDLLSQFGEEYETTEVEDNVEIKEEVFSEEEPIDEIQEEPVAEDEDDEFEAVISAMASELDDEVEEVIIEEEPEESQPEETVLEDFEELAQEEEESLLAQLGQSTEAIKTTIQESTPVPIPVPEPVAPATAKVSFDNYINSLTMKTPVDLLLATAYYIENFEDMSKFTTKDISAMTMKVFKRPVSPNTVLTAVNKGYIEVVPDFTGNAESNEYSLTDSGRHYVMTELS